MDNENRPGHGARGGSSFVAAIATAGRFVEPRTGEAREPRAVPSLTREAGAPNRSARVPTFRPPSAAPYYLRRMGQGVAARRRRA
jgi:hypothetical protein